MLLTLSEVVLCCAARHQLRNKHIDMKSMSRKIKYLHPTSPVKAKSCRTSLQVQEGKLREAKGRQVIAACRNPLWEIEDNVEANLWILIKSFISNHALTYRLYAWIFGIMILSLHIITVFSMECWILLVTFSQKAENTFSALKCVNLC